MTIPGVPITTVPNEGDSTYPSLVAIKTTESVGPSVANRQPIQLRTRDLTLRDRVNKLIDALTFIGQGAAGTTDYYLPRDGTLAMLADLDMNDNRVDDIKRITMTAVGSGGEGIFAGSNRIQDVADPTAAQDAATRAYVLAQVGGGVVNAIVPNSAWRSLSVDATGGGVQSATSSIIITSSMTGNGPVRPPQRVRCRVIYYTDDSYTTPAGTWDFTVYGNTEGTNLTWQTVFEPPSVISYPANWRYGASGSGVELPLTYWGQQNDNRTANQFGRFTLSEAFTPIVTLAMRNVFYLEDSSSSAEEASVLFGWDDANDEFEVELRSDVRNLVLSMELQWYRPIQY